MKSKTKLLAKLKSRTLSKTQLRRRTPMHLKTLMKRPRLTSSSRMSSVQSLKTRKRQTPKLLPIHQKLMMAAGTLEETRDSLRRRLRKTRNHLRRLALKRSAFLPAHQPSLSSPRLLSTRWSSQSSEKWERKTSKS